MTNRPPANKALLESRTELRGVFTAKRDQWSTWIPGTPPAVQNANPSENAVEDGT